MQPLNKPTKGDAGYTAVFGDEFRVYAGNAFEAQAIANLALTVQGPQPRGYNTPRPTVYLSAMPYTVAAEAVANG